MLVSLTLIGKTFQVVGRQGKLLLVQVPAEAEGCLNEGCWNWNWEKESEACRGLEGSSVHRRVIMRGWEGWQGMKR